MLILLLSLAAVRKQHETLGSDCNINQMLLNTLTSVLEKKSPLEPGRSLQLWQLLVAASEGRGVALGLILVPEAIRGNTFPSMGFKVIP